MEDPPAVRHNHQQLGRDDGKEGGDDRDDGGDGDDDDDGGITCETVRQRDSWRLVPLSCEEPGAEGEEGDEGGLLSKVNWPPTLRTADWLHCWPLN